MMRKTLLIFAFVLLLIPTVMAVEVTVKTYAGREVSIALLNTGNGDSVGSYVNVTESGTLVANIATGQSNVDINVIIRTAQGRIESMKKFKGYSTGSSILLDMTTPVVTTPAPEPVVNDTPAVVENTTEVVVPAPEQEPAVVVENKTANSGGVISGFSIFENVGDMIDMNVVYYVVGGLAIIVIIFFGYRYRSSFGRFFKKEIDYFPKLGYSHTHVEEDRDDRVIRAAEHRLKKAQDDFERAKRLREVEKKYHEAKRELERTKRGL